MNVQNDEKIKNKRLVKHSVIVLIFLLLVLFLIKLRLSEITVIGADNYDEEEAKELVFSGYWDTNTLVCFVNNLLNIKKDLPFIADYDIELTGLTSCELIIYEKSPVGCVDYMSNYMYFDKDGIIIESSPEKLPGIPVIEGIDFGHIVLGEVLPVENDKIFTDIMTLTQQLDEYEIGCEKIYYSADAQITITLEGGNIKAELGTNENISSKISALNDMLPGLNEAGLKGTLYLDNYNELSREDAVSFRETA